MLKRAIHAIFIVTLGMAFWAADAADHADVDISGEWKGTYTVTQVSGPVKFTAVFYQAEDGTVTGTYATGTGVYGTGTGKVVDGKVVMDWTNTTPSCPGYYRNVYTLDGDSMTFTVNGYDCLGPEKGTGSAKRVTGSWLFPS